jgi:hypothetical protein
LYSTKIEDIGHPIPRVWVRMKAARHLSYTRCALSHAAVSSATARLIIWSDVCKVARRHIWLPGRRRANEIISHRTCALDSAPIDPHQNLWPENAARHITTPCIANIPWEAAATRRQRVDVAPADLMGFRPATATASRSAQMLGTKTTDAGGTCRFPCLFLAYLI